MIYFLDSNFLIDAKNWHFPLDKRLDFWKWLLSLGQKDILKIPESVYEEINRGNDELVNWINENKNTFLCKKVECIQSLSSALAGYGEVTEIDLEQLKADPYVIAHALAVNGSVVTEERPKETLVIKNKKIPTVCDGLHIPCLTLPTFMWELRGTLP